MTDKKYQQESKNTVHPWYKERLRTKCLKHPVQKQQLTGALDGRRWRFLKQGFDDFRDGYPKLEDVTLTQPKHSTEPTIFGLSSQSHPVRLSKSRFSKEQVCFSKQNCLRQMHRQHVDGVEQSLSAHPLALYPHLGSGMPPELFDEVLSVLDPAMCSRIKTPVTFLAQQVQSRTDNVVTCEGRIQESSTEKKKEQSTSAVPTKERTQGCASRNPYKFRKDKKTKENPVDTDRHLSSLSEDEDVKRTSKLFCDWVATLGGETNSMSESNIVNQFFGGYEKKPPLKFPAQVMRSKELTDAPHNSVECPNNNNSCRVKLKNLEINKTSSVKAKYGAWYISPKSWKKQSTNELLRDPSETEDLDQQNSEKDEELKAIHGTQAFKQFILGNKLRMPQFLSALFSEKEQEDENRGRKSSLSEKKDRH